MPKAFNTPKFASTRSRRATAPWWIGPFETSAKASDYAHGKPSTSINPPGITHANDINLSAPESIPVPQPSPAFQPTFQKGRGRGTRGGRSSRGRGQWSSKTPQTVFASAYCIIKPSDDAWFPPVQRMFQALLREATARNSHITSPGAANEYVRNQILAWPLKHISSSDIHGLHGTRGFFEGMYGKQHFSNDSVMNTSDEKTFSRGSSPNVNQRTHRRECKSCKHKFNNNNSVDASSK